MRLVRRYGAVVSTVGLAALLTTTMDLARAQVAPPLATQPVFTAPVLVPSATGVPTPSGAPVPPQPIHIPAGPGPVAVPNAPPVTIIQAPAPAVVQSSPPHHAAEPKPAILMPEPKPDEATPASPTAPVPAPAPAAPTPAEPAQVTPATPPSEPVPAIQPAPPPSEPAKPAQSEAPAAAPAPPPSPAPQLVTPPSAATMPQTVAPPPVPSGQAPGPQAPEPPPPPVVTQLVPVEVEVAARPVIFVTGVTTWDKAEEKLGGVFVTLAEAVKKLGVQQSGPPLVEYIESDSDDVGFRAMVPIEVAPKGKLPKGVKVGKSTGGKALKFRHAGPLDDLEEVYGRIDDELTKRNLDTRTIVEEYDPDALASPEDRVVMDIYVFPK